MTLKSDLTDEAIPDIGLRCPHCDYRLTGLTVRYCPECGEPFVLSDLLPEVLEESVAARRWQLDLMVADSGLAVPQELVEWLANLPRLTPTTAMGIIRQLDRDENASLTVEHAKHLLDRNPDDELYDWSNLPAPTYTGTELPIPDLGLACAECGESLTGWQTFDCPQCGTPADLKATVPDRPLVRVYRSVKWEHLQMAKLVLDTNRVPNQLGNENLQMAMGELPFVYVSSELLVPRDHYFDALFALHHDWPQPTTALSADEWPCPECNETSPATFDLCWNCAAQRPAPQSSDHANNR